MTIFFSKSTNGFYVDGVHEAHQIPEDAVEITDEQHKSLLEGQSTGLIITSDENGYPINAEQVPNEEIVAARQRANEAKASALAKLSVLGLSEEEVLALLK